MLAYGRGRWAVSQKPKLIRFLRRFGLKIASHADVLTGSSRVSAWGRNAWRTPKNACVWGQSKNGHRLCLFWSGIGCGFPENYGSVWTYLWFWFHMMSSSLWLSRLQLRQHTQSSKLLVHFGQFGINRRVDWIGSLVLLTLGFQMNLTTSSYFSAVNSPR